MHEKNHEHEFNWKNLKIFDQGNLKNVRKSLEAWYSDQLSINRYTDTEPIYELIWKSSITHKTRGQPTTTVKVNTKINENNETYENNQSQTRLLK